jgi:hypothetical protein
MQEERAMWVYQFGYLDELRGFGDRLVWINPLWFWDHHPTGKPPSGQRRSRPLRRKRAKTRQTIFWRVSDPIRNSVG